MRIYSSERSTGGLAVVTLALTLAACAPAAAPTPQRAAEAPRAGPAAPAAPTDWSAIVAAAQREGVVECACPPRPDFARIIKEGFEAANSGIRLAVTGAPLPEFPVKVGKEQEAGIYLWDVYMFGPGPEVYDLKNQGGFEPFRNYMVGPDVGTDADWAGGFQRALIDREKQYIFAYWFSVGGQVSVNRELLPSATINAYSDLYDPMYKGKVVWVDPRSGGAGSNVGAFVYKKYGREGLKRLLVDQEALLVKGNVELAEQLMRGGKGVSLPSLSQDTLIPFVQAGVKLNLEDVGGPEMVWASVGGSTPAVFKNPPHPNATKVFINWVLSRDTQKLLGDQLGYNSARKDVAPSEPKNAPQPGTEYWIAQTEESLIEVRQEMQRVARELVP